MIEDILVEKCIHLMRPSTEYLIRWHIKKSKKLKLTLCLIKPQSIEKYGGTEV
jgi:hypothetical protein